MCVYLEWELYSCREMKQLKESHQLFDELYVLQQDRIYACLSDADALL